MEKNRLEAFSDGVLAIIITIMVLELKAPIGDDISNLIPLAPIFLSYILSFTYIGIYWNNHHHMLHTIRKVNGSILWANLHLLFWLSLIPFTTAWMGENKFAPEPTAVYGIILLLSAISYFILQKSIIRLHGKDSVLAKAVGKDSKGNISLFLYVIAILCTFIHEWISGILYFAVALLWLIPDKRIERLLEDNK